MTPSNTGRALADDLEQAAKILARKPCEVYGLQQLCEKAAAALRSAPSAEMGREARGIKYWWSEDRQWFCILVNDGTSQATISLSVEEVEAMNSEAMQTPRFLEFQKECEERALQLLDEAAALALPKAGEMDPPLNGFKPIYVKRWRTLIMVPKSIAEEVRATLAALPPSPSASVPGEGVTDKISLEDLAAMPMRCDCTKPFEDWALSDQLISKARDVLAVRNKENS